jgi:hypothetical protein
MYTITENEFFIYDSKTKTGKWVKQYQFWNGDLTDTNFNNDSRFCEVKNRRKLVKLMGVKTNIKFPIVYPLILDNGTVLSAHEKFEYKNDEDE